MAKPLDQNVLKERMAKIDELIREANDPERFANRIDEIKPPMRKIVDSILNLELDDDDADDDSKQNPNNGYAASNKSKDPEASM